MSLRLTTLLLLECYECGLGRLRLTLNDKCPACGSTMKSTHTVEVMPGCAYVENERDEKTSNNG